MTDPHRPPAGPPALRPPGPSLPVPTGSSAPTPRAALWKRLTRTRRGAAGIGVLAAALLLWPFSGLSWIPWLAGLAVLVLLALLRLDRVLHGWTWHVAGLVVVAGLMVSTSPWAWALAASLGVLLAGLLRLPAWRLAAVGAALCLVSGAAFAFTTYQVRQEARAQNDRENTASFALAGERIPERVLPALLEGIGQGDVVAVCGLMDEEARAGFVAAVGSPDCASAVTALQRAGAAPEYEDLQATTVPDSGGWVTDGCRTPWADDRLGGPELGRVLIRQSPPPGGTYFLSGFAPCPPS